MTLSFTAAPALPSLSDPANFDTRALALFQWLTGTHVPELEAVDGFYVQGQDVNIDSGTFVVDVTNNRVGIGTASPASLLHVAGSGDRTVTIETTNDLDARLKLIRPSGRSWEIANEVGTFAIKYGAAGATADQTAISISGVSVLLKDPADSSSVAAVNSGNFGIGATSPSAKLHTRQTADTTAMLVEAQHATLTKSICALNATRAASSAYSMLTAYSSDFADLEFKLSGDGNGTCDGSWTGGGADYAEYFEWADGNPDNEDRRGWSVVLAGDKIAPAQPGDDPFGVVSANPSVVGDGDMDRWKGKYLRDDFGAYIFEDYEVVEWIETVPALTEEQAVPAVLDLETGEEIEPARTEIVEVEPARDVPHSYAADAVPDGLTVPKDAARTVQQRRKLNPDYDPDRPYTPRANRPEWSTIGLMGKLRLRKGQPVGARWVKMRDVSATVEEWLVR